MLKQQLVPDKFKVISGSVLKLIAMLTMLIDHVASHLMTNDLVLFSVGSRAVPLRGVLIMVGRVAFPLFCFLLTEGFLHTRNRLRYGISLLLFALISEIPWDLEHYNSVFNMKTQNVFFTLLLGYLGICAIELLKQRPVVQLASLLALAVTAMGLKADYGLWGYIFVILLYVLRDHETLRVLTAFLVSRPWFTMAAFIPITLYNGKRGFIKGPVLKYAFYIFYPAHILVIYLFKFVI